MDLKYFLSCSSYFLTMDKKRALKDLFSFSWGGGATENEFQLLESHNLPDSNRKSCFTKFENFSHTAIQKQNDSLNWNKWLETVLFPLSILVCYINAFLAYEIQRFPVVYAWILELQCVTEDETTLT